jgi:hypothetical protein
LKHIKVDVCKAEVHGSSECVKCDVRLSAARAKRRCPPQFYLYMVLCDNCDFPTTFTVPRGVYVRDFLTNMDCPYCGCAYKHTFASVYGEENEV